MENPLTTFTPERVERVWDELQATAAATEAARLVSTIEVALSNVSKGSSFSKVVLGCPGYVEVGSGWTSAEPRVHPLNVALMAGNGLRVWRVTARLGIAVKMFRLFVGWDTALDFERHVFAGLRDARFNTFDFEELT